MTPRPQTTRGAALIPALLVVAIASSLAAALATRMDSSIQQMIYRRDEVAANLLARAAIDYSASVLFDDARQTGEVDTLQEVWANKTGALPVDGGELSGEIQDGQRLFNINNLIDESGAPSVEDVTAFNKLSRLVGANPGLGDTLAQLMAPKEKDGKPRFFAHIDELKQLDKLPSQQIENLRPFVIALPRRGSRTKININTARPEVIAAYIPGYGVASVMELVGSDSARKVFNSVSEFPSQPPDMSQFFSVNSNYFVCKGLATQGRARITTESLLQRRGSRWPVPVYIRMSST